MPTTTLARPLPSSTSSRPRDLGAIAAVLATAAAALMMLTSLLADPARLDVEIENPTDFRVSVDVRGTDDSRLGLGTVTAGGADAFTGVIDRGESWFFEFTYAGVRGGRIEVSRDDVRRGAVTVPASVEEVFRDAGLSPPPS